MSIIPQNNYVLCIKHETIKNNSSLFVVNDKTFDTYKVVKLSESIDNAIVSVNDVVVVNSTGTKIKDDGNVFFLFNQENIIAKVV